MRRYCGSWRRYLWEGQQLNDTVTKTVPEDADFFDRVLIKHRKYLAFLLPFAIMQVIWWTTAFRFNWFPLYETRWQMPIVMFFGSTVAGMTSEGGGAVAFPVMTLLLHIDPITARDFSLIIQSAGMTCAMCVVLIMQIQIEKRAIFFGTLGSVPGIVVGSLFLDAYLSAAQKKMLFVSIWSSFAIALFILNSQHKRRTYDIIPEFSAWKAIVLILTGFVGGISDH
ncbi:putative membrane transporter protein [Trichostrongylus colubriformis]|uniref:Membrane transporter protein n=1 Tax=Trichostrongylus colubriformis TaxID=6319 RepID=A0AAN8FDY7_TRICO